MIGTIAAPGSSNAARPGFRTMAQMAAVYADEFSLELPPAGQTPEDRVNWVTRERAAQGRTPAQWVEWAHASFNLDAPATTPAARATDIVASMSVLYATLGLRMDGAAIAAEAAALPAPVRGAFADLLAVVTASYVEQVALAPTVQARLADGFDVHDTLVTRAERDAMAARQARIVAAVNVFRAQTREVFPAMQASTPLFQDPAGLVVLGSTGVDTYTRDGVFLDPILLVDPSGDDTYRNSAGGACPLSVSGWIECNGLALSVVADLGDASADTYSYDGAVSAVQGAGGPGGLGVLIDAGGNDSYYAKMTRTNVYPFFQYFDGGAQGFGYGGSGLLLDGLGDDTYRFDVYSTRGYSIWALAQGFGGAGGLGIASDLTGNDRWLSNGLGTPVNRLGDFQGIYTGGGGFYGGVGIASDTGLGADVWHSYVTAPSTDYYAQGFGAFAGVGILFEDGGDDSYIAYERATANPPTISPLLNCAFGTASFAGVGVMMELGGNDVYRGETVSTRGAYTMDFGFGGPGVAYGVFTDLGGDDSYTMIATGSPSVIDGYGYYRTGLGGDLLNWPLGHNSFGAFSEIGGNDTYVGGHARNNDQWPFGADRGV